MAHFPQRAKLKNPNSGFDALVEFLPLDAKGEIVENPTSLPPYTYVGVRGKLAGLPFFRVFTYLISNWEEKSSEHFKLAFNKLHAPLPSGFDFDPSKYVIQDILPSGKIRKIKPSQQEEVVNVNGMWCIHASGYVRYYTSATFKTSLELFAPIMAERILTATLVQMMDHLQAEMEQEDDRTLHTP